MKLFEFKPNDTITPELILGDQSELLELGSNKRYPALELSPSRGVVAFESAAKLNESDLANQFIVFQLSNNADGPAIFDSTEITSSINGSSEEPDVYVNLEMQSFHLGKDVHVDKKSRATMRINIGKDENSSDKYFDAVFWSIAAGMDLYNNFKNERAEPKDLKADFGKAFGNRPIEIPGGLAKMTFEVVKHQEPKWWQKIFKFLQSDTGKGLVSTLGFPGVSSKAIGLVDELLNKLDRSKPEILFKSRPMKLALTEKAKNDYTGGSERVKIGSMSPGFCVLARGKDYRTIIAADAYYHPTRDILVPSGVSTANLLSGNYNDPFENVTYAVFRIGMKATKLDTSFRFS